MVHRGESGTMQPAGEVVAIRRRAGEVTWQVTEHYVRDDIALLAAVYTAFAVAFGLVVFNPPKSVD